MYETRRPHCHVEGYRCNKNYNKDKTGSGGGTDCNTVDADSGTGGYDNIHRSSYRTMVVAAGTVLLCPNHFHNYTENSALDTS
jgi:hypothetical protein